MKSKLIKFIMFITASLIMNAAASQEAGSPGPKFTPGQKADRMTAHLKQQLTLSDDQAEKVKAVYLDHLQKMESGAAKRKEAHAELESNLSKIFTEDQLSKFKTMEAERREQMKARRNQEMQPAPDDQDSKQNNSQGSDQK